MGKKTRKEREEKREDFAAKRSREKRKSVLIAAGVIGAVAVIVGISAFQFVTQGSSTPGAPPGAGALGDEHVHSSMLVRIHGDKFDFSLPTYQIKSAWIHFEAQDGTTIHRHASGVTMGYLFDTLNLGLTDQCYAFPPSDGREFCTNEEFSLKFYINHQQVDNITDYVFRDGDRILVSYGDETLDEIEQQLAELDSQPILA